jgi:hypothetical protein
MKNEPLTQKDDALSVVVFGLSMLGIVVIICWKWLIH